jgi:sirohydrochlorin cobaltochelatase
MEQALILFGHGARDARWAAPFERLAGILRAQLASTRPQVAVHLAFLEFMQPNLPDLVAQLAAGGCRDITLVPVFLGQGGHVLRDLPPMLAALQAQFPEISLRHSAAVGESDAVLAAMADYCLAALPLLP